jgi:hypothetical protein
VSNVSPTGVPLMVIGYSAATPFPISGLGLTTDPTCLLTISPDALVGALATVGSTASLSIPIPANLAFAGQQLFLQGVQLELTTGTWNLSDQGIATLGF